jgi:hypothetical protein
MIKASEVRKESKRVKETNRQKQIKADNERRDRDQKWADDNIDSYMHQLEKEIKASSKKGYGAASIEVPCNDAGKIMAWRMVENLKKAGYEASCNEHEGGSDWYDSYWVNATWSKERKW